MKLAKDKWWSFDKLQHAGRGMLIYLVLHTAFPGAWDFVPFCVAVGFAVLYEVRDAYFADGFSWRDIVCDTLGAASMWLLWGARMP